VVFGQSAAFASAVDLNTLDGTTGFRLDGIDASDQSGRSVSSAGDVNGDGFDDLIIGARAADPGGDSIAGESYVVFGGNFTGGAETQVGGAGIDTLTAGQGAAAVDILIGGRGNDTLISDGGDDILRGGEGDDVLAIPNIDFSGARRVLGGNGTDTLRLDGSGITLDLTNIPDNRIIDVERIDITGTGANSLTLDVREVLNLSSTSNTVTVHRDVDDTVSIGSGWTQQGNTIIDGETFEVFTQAAATLNIQILGYTFPDDTAGDSWTLRRNGANVELFDGTSVLDTVTLSAITELTVFAAPGEANTLTIDYAHGGFFDIPNFSFVGSTGTDELAVTGTGLTQATLSSAGSILSTASLQVSDVGQNDTLGFSDIDTLTVSGLLNLDVSDPLHIGDDTLSVTAATFVNLDSATTVTGGTITTSGGLHLQASEVVSGTGTINSRISSDQGSTIQLMGDSTLGDATAFDGINLDGRLVIGANTVTLNDGHKAVLGSETTLGFGGSSGTLNSDNGVEIPDTHTLVGQGTVNTVSDEFENQGFVQGNGTGLVFEHLVTGAGDFGGTNTFNGGTDFGNSPAKIDAGNINFGATNSHKVEIGGLVAGNEFDQVNASGTVQLDGTLEVLLLDLGNGFTPQAGQTFEVINASSLMGTFATTNLPALPAGLGWDVVYASDSLTLGIVALEPEITVTGLNDVEITDGDNQASAADGTNYGTILRGTTPVSRTFTVTNTGGAPLTLGAPTIPTGFTLTEGLNGSIDPGQSDTFTVQLDADVNGTKSGQLTFTTNDSDENPFNFRIIGKVQEPTPPEILVRGFNNVVITDGDNQANAADGSNFGSVLEDGATKTQTFTVINLGDLPLTLGSVNVPTGFTLLKDLSGPLATGESDTIIVRLESDIVGTKSGQLNFTTNDPDESPFNFRITGKVIDVVHPEIRVNGLNGVEILDGDNKATIVDGTNFGSVAQGSTPITRTFTVTNDGVDPLFLGVMTIPNGFSLVEGLPSTLGVGQSNTFTVQLDTTTTGTKSGHLSFNTNDADERRFNFRILGKVL